MSLRPSQDPETAAAVLIDKRIGTAFDKVQMVSDIIPEIRYLVENMELIAAAAQITQVDAVLPPGVVPVTTMTNLSTASHLADEVHLGVGSGVTVDWADTGDGFFCALLNRSGGPIYVTLVGFTTSTIINAAGVSVIPANARVLLRCVTPDDGVTRECWCG